MKKLLITIITAFVFSTSLLAQVDVKVNLLGFTMKNYGGSIGYQFNEKISGAIYTNLNNYYSMDMIDYHDLMTDESSFSSFSISPEVNFCFNPKENNYNSFFSVYLRSQNSTIYDMKQMIYSSYNETLSEITYDINKQSLIFGLGFGEKKIFKSGIFINGYLGLGYVMISNTKYTDTRVEELFVNMHTTFPSYMNFRAEFSIGYRFGKKK